MVKGWGNRIRAARIAEGLSPKDLARACNVSKESVSQWETESVKSMKPVHLFLVADKLKRNPRWIAMNKGPEHVPETDPEQERWNGLYEKLKRDSRLEAVLLLLDIDQNETEDADG